MSINALFVCVDAVDVKYLIISIFVIIRVQIIILCKILSLNKECLSVASLFQTSNLILKHVNGYFSLKSFL